MSLETTFLEALGAFGKFIDEIDKPKTPPTTENGAAELLTAAKLAELKWMSTKQLESIYHCGARKTRIDDDPAAYAELKWFSVNQLEAIFGKQEDEGNG